ncbi:MAG: NAD kinase [Prevotellaceae bacterium]|jgi:NAD+ kinase|nr:NAD kinase [Prevotellaceae bacterium]
MKFAIIGNTFQAKKAVYVEQLLGLLKAHRAQIVICREFYRFLTTGLGMVLDSGIECFEAEAFDADMVISVGGDGTFLKAANRVGKKGIPVLGINTGRLGFLADLSPEGMEHTIEAIHQGRFTLEERSLLQVRATGTPLHAAYALNEVAVLKHDSSSMITIRTAINGAHLATYQADGLVIATPTGSTAYSLSVGGPIIVPQSKTITLTPVAPHSLNVRPIVICDDWEVGIEVESRSHNYLVAVDGSSDSYPDATRLQIARADYTLKIVKRPGHLFFDTLRDKLMWGADIR